jgi:hypothetical protein
MEASGIGGTHANSCGARAARGRERRLALRLAAVAALIAATMLALPALSGAHTWNLAQDFALSPDGVTAPPNPFTDSYGNAGVWAAGWGGGGTYSTSGGVTAYSGLGVFTVAPASSWSEGVGGTPGAEAWIGPESYPYTGVNSTSSPAAVWPAESVFMHPYVDTAIEQPRAAVRWVSPVTGTVSIEAAFNDLDCGGGDGMDYSVDVQPAGSTTLTHLAGKAVGYCGSGSYSAAAVSVTKGDTYYFSVGDGGHAEFSWDTTGVTVNITDGATDTMSLSAPAPISATYKHAMTPATVSGKDSDGDPVTLSAANVPAGLAFNASTGVLSGTPTVPAGRYVITFTASDGKGDQLSRHAILTVAKATCTLTNKPTQLASPKGQILSAKLTDAATKAALAGREVNFGANGYYVGQTKTSSAGVAKLKVTLAEDGIYLVGSNFSGDAYYEPCSVASEELVTVSPATYTATGAAALTVGKSTSRLGFNASAVAATGQPMDLYAPTGTFSGEAITALSKPTATSATWTGTGTWNGVPAEYTITASDPSSGSDTVAMTVTSEGVVVWSSGGAKPVKGDVKVH